MTEDMRKAETLALETFKTEHSVTPKQFVVRLTTHGVRDNVARAAMWDLLDRREMTLSTELTLSLTKSKD